LTVHNHYVPVEGPTSLSFNDAPIDLLSIHFTGREGELADIGRILDIIHDDAPTRCVIHGMDGLGKTQFSLQFAKTSFSYSLIFWVSATTIIKLNHGFTKLLNLISHPDRSYIDQGTRSEVHMLFLPHLSTPA
jgi:hypothetical protein